MNFISASAGLWFTGMFLVFAGERVAVSTVAHYPFTGLGIMLVLGVTAHQFRQRSAEKDPGRQRAFGAWLAASGVGLLSLVLYATTTDGAVAMMGLDDGGAERWYGAITSLYLVVWSLGAIPLLFADRAIIENPVVLPVLSASRAVHSGIATAFALCLAFPINYLANAHNVEYDYAAVRTTKAGSATLSLVRNMADPVNATLFYTSSSDVKQKLIPYFDALQGASDGRFTYEVVDQATVPERAEELKIRDNGSIVFTMGESTEKFKVNTDIKRAKRDLQKLDQTVQKHLLKLVKGQMTAYMLTGHGEASPREKGNAMRKINSFKKALQDLNYKVKEFGLTEGSADAVPDDAGLLVIAAPKSAILPEEERAIGEYLDRGGRLLVMLSATPRARPGEVARPVEGVLAKLGLEASEHALAHQVKYYPMKRGKADRHLLFSNRFGSHASVKTLARNSREATVLMPYVVGIKKLDEQTGKVSTLIRSFPDTWEDENFNVERDDNEEARVWDLAVAVEGNAEDEEEGYRAVVVGTSYLYGDMFFGGGNKHFARDTVIWLEGDETILGAVENEADIKIRHTRDEDVYWFYATVFGIPFGITFLGLTLVRLRRRE